MCRALLVFLVLLVLTSLPIPAAAEDLPPLREFIDGMRSAACRRASALVLPEKTPPVAADAVLTMEYRVGHYSVSEGILRFQPGKDGVEVSRVAIGGYLPGFKDLAIRGIGLAYRVTRISSADYAALLGELLRIRDVRIEHKAGAEPEGSPWGTSTADGDLHVRLVAGKQALIDDESNLPAIAGRPGRVLREVGEDERAFLWHRRIEAWTAKWTFRAQAAPAALADRLLTELRMLPGDAERALSLRIRTLGSLGHRSARDALKRLRGKLDTEEGEDVIEKIDVALTQIDTLHATDKEARLVQLLDDPVVELQDWAHDALHLGFPRRYRKWIIEMYEAGDRRAQLNALSRLSHVTPEDPTLAKLAFGDEDLHLRMAGARILQGIDPTDEVVGFFHATARDKSLRTYEYFHARTGSIETLTWRGPLGDPAKIHDTLIAILLDEKDDVTVRGSAALGLAYMGDRRAVPALLKVFQSPVPAKPCYLHEPPGWVSDEMAAKARSLSRYLQTDDPRMEAARALGILRAREAVAPFAARLVHAPKEDEHNLESYIGEALSRIGSLDAVPILTKMRDAQDTEEDAGTWQRRLDILKALNGKHPARALLTLLDGTYSDGIWVELALTDLASIKELESLRKERPSDKDVIAAALERKRARRPKPGGK